MLKVDPEFLSRSSGVAEHWLVLTEPMAWGPRGDERALWPT